MYWPSQIPLESSAPVLYAGSVEIHSTLVVAGLIVLAALVLIGIAIIGWATS